MIQASDNGSVTSTVRLDEVGFTFDEMVDVQSSGYNMQSIEHFTKRCNESIKNYTLLQGIRNTDCTDVIGNKLLDDLIKSMEVGGKAFVQAIKRDINFEDYIEDLMVQRSLCQDNIDKINVDNILIVPELSRFMYKNDKLLESKVKKFLEENVGVTLAEKDKFRIDEMKKLESDAMYRYNEAMDAYESDIKYRNSAAIELKGLKRELEKITVLEIMIKTFSTLNFLLINKIKDAIADKYTELYSLLQGSTIIKSTKTKMINPIGLYKLSGVMEILQERFRKVGLVTVATSLVAALDHRLIDKDVFSNPTIVLQYTDRFVTDWIRSGMMKQLTLGQLSSVILINLIPKGQLKLKLLEVIEQHALDKIKDTEEDSDVNDLVLYYKLTDALKKWEERNNFANSNKKKIHTSIGDTLSNKANVRNKDILENAADAEIADAAIDNDKKYKQDVLKSQNITFKDSQGKVHTYVAVSKPSSICNKCYPESGTAAFCQVNGKDKPCFAIKCLKCNKYGHKQAYCQQAI